MSENLLLTFNRLIENYGGIQATLAFIEQERTIYYRQPKPLIIYETKYQYEKARQLRKLITQ